MGKKRRLNRFISKWIKSDLPEERSTVLLLGVTRIPTSPLASRRPCSIAAVPSAVVVGGRLQRRNSSGASKKGALVRRHSSKKTTDCRRHQVPPVAETPTPTPSPSSERCSERSHLETTTFSIRCIASDDVSTPVVAAGVMERSVDSIGTCSLDVDASADLSDWSDISSAGTLRSTSIAVAPSSPEPHLPSYLSLACTVNGYSTTTHYDPIRLARSRDASPHRLDTDLVTPNKPNAVYTVQNNLLSPPNLVPLPDRIKQPKKMENAIAQQHHHGEFYSAIKTATYLSKESFTSGLFAGIAQDTTDGCLENGHHAVQSKCVSFESKSVTSINGQTKCISETSMGQEYKNGQETKSFIQQRVERLYGPGALAQGFFKPQKKRLSEGEDKSLRDESDKHSKSMNERQLAGEDLEPVMRQSTSSPTLPVLRHLRPEFRAQLPFITPKKGAVEGAMQKSVTIPRLKEEGKANGHVVAEGGRLGKEEANGHRVEEEVKDETANKDGHYFLIVLEVQSKRLLELATRVEEDITTPGLSEDLIGKLRSAAGKAKLLVTQKMQQFRGLCTNNINRSDGEAFPTTNEDLQGFWDMVMLQVDQVDAIFKEIEALKANGWREIAETPEAVTNGSTKVKKVISRPVNRPVSAANEEARKQREAQRKKMIEDRRRAMKIAQQSKPSIEIFVPETTS